MQEFLPGKGAKKQTAADRTIQILSKTHPLALTAIFRKLKGEYKMDISFQAARKAASQLVENGVLTRNEKKEYEISRKWILESKKFFDNLVDEYQNRGKNFSGTFKNENYAEYKFNTLFELDNFWNDLLMHWANNLEKNEPKEVCSYNNCHWWFLINLGYEMTLWKYIINKGINSTFVTSKRNFLNEMAMKNYNSMKAQVAFFTKKPPFPENTDINACGNNIIQVTFPKEIMEKLDFLVKKYKSAEDVDPKSLHELVDTKCDIRLLYFRNPEAAKAYREKILASIGKKQ